ncbi:MAG: bifunctional DNA primase/polymerase [Aggregatilineales bacterium]
MPHVPPFHAWSVADKRRLALRYAKQFGMAAFPLRGKVPLVAEWKPCLESPGVYGSDDEWAPATGYALAPVQGDTLAVLDVDDPEVAQALLAQFPCLAATFQVMRADHAHFYLHLAAPLSQACLKHWNTAPKRETASLRGIGAYVVGPLSDHAFGDTYRPNGLPIVTLTLFEQTQLLAWFTPTSPAGPSPSPDGVQAIRLYPTQDERTGEPTAIAQTLRMHGYHRNKDWLNGPCIHPENHANADHHASFGVNIESGVGHCFKCGNYAPSEVAAALALRQESLSPNVAARPYAFVTVVEQPPAGAAASLDDESVQVELNTIVAIMRQGKHAAARLYSLLFAHSRATAGQHTYHKANLIALGQRYGLSGTQVMRAARTLSELGLLIKLEQGGYRRVSVARAREILALGDDYGLVRIANEAFSGSITKYTAAVTLAVERLLPNDRSSAEIAAAIGISKRSLYDQEARVGVERETQIKRANLATATIHFATVCDANGQRVGVVGGMNAAHGAMEWAGESGGSAWGWQQSPSLRQLPPVKPTTERTIST